MRIFMFWACLGLTYALEQKIFAKDSSNQLTLKRQTSKIAEDNLDTVLPNSKPLKLEPITIETKIPSDLVIPSIPAGSNIGFHQGIQINPHPSINSYPTESVYVPSFGNGFLNTGSGIGLPIITPGQDAIPVQQIGPTADFKTLGNLDTSFGGGLGSLEIKPVEYPKPVIHLAPAQQKSNTFSIQEAIDVGKLEFSKNQHFKVNTGTPAFISSINNLVLLKGHKKLESNKPPEKISYSIEKAPEVGSIHKKGPLVPSDIPSITELIKIFNSKYTSVGKIDTEIQTTTVTSESSDDKRDPKYILDQIDERISPRRNKTKTVLNLASRTTDTISKPIDQEDREVPSDVDATTNKSVITETTIGIADSINISEASTTTSSNIVGNGIDITSNEKQDDRLGNSTEDTRFRISEDLGTVTENTNITGINVNVPENISQIQISTTNQVLSEQLTQLTASSFLNASDILKETNDFKAIIQSSEHPAALEPIDVEDESVTIISDLTEDRSQASTEKAKLNESDKITSETETAVETTESQLFGSRIALNSLNNSVNISPETDATADYKASTEKTEIVNKSDEVTSDIETVAKTTESTLHTFFIDLNLPDSSIEISSGTDATINTDKFQAQAELNDVGNSTESIQSSVSNTENLQGSLNPSNTSNNLTSSCGCDLVNENVTSDNSSQLETLTNQTESVIISTSSISVSTGNVKARISDNLNLEQTNDLLNNESSTVVPSLEDTTDSTVSEASTATTTSENLKIESRILENTDTSTDSSGNESNTNAWSRQNASNLVDDISNDIVTISSVFDIGLARSNFSETSESSTEISEGESTTKPFHLLKNLIATTEIESETPTEIANDNVTESGESETLSTMETSSV